MEIAHHLKDLDTQWGVDLVLFDGEELVFGNDPRRRRVFSRLEGVRTASNYVVDSGRTRSRYVAASCLIWSAV